LAAVTVLGYLATSSKKAEDSAKSLGDGLDFSGKSARELIDAITDLEAAQRKQIRSSYESEQASLRDADAALTASRNKREQAKAELELVRARYYAQSGNSKGGIEVKGGLGAQVVAAEREIASLDAGIASAEKGRRNAAL
jgi:hypothetical protein